MYPMTRSSTGVQAAWSRRPRHIAAAIMALATTAGLGVASGRPALASPGSAAPAPVVTRAALDPSRVSGRGADPRFAEQEAENAATDGTVIGPSTAAYTLAAEASGRSAVSLAPGQYVQFTLPAAANAINVRYSIPDAPAGGGITAPLDVTVNGGHRQTMTLTSQYAWLYNEYPFSNDPAAGPLHPDWWTTECNCVPDATTPAPVFPTPFRPNHFYDEQRLLLGRTHPAGAPATHQMDPQPVAPRRFGARAANVVRFGADPTGRRDSATAFDQAIAFAQRTHLPVYIPPGPFPAERAIIV